MASNNNVSGSTTMRVPSAFNILAELAASTNSEKIRLKLDTIAKRVLDLKNDVQAPAFNQEIAQIEVLLEDAELVQCAQEPLEILVKEVTQKFKSLISRMQNHGLEVPKNVQLPDEPTKDSLAVLFLEFQKVALLPKVSPFEPDIKKIKNRLEIAKKKGAEKPGKQPDETSENFFVSLQILQDKIAILGKRMLAKSTMGQVQTEVDENTLKSLDTLLWFYPKSCRALWDLHQAIERGEYGDTAKKFSDEGDPLFSYIPLLCKLMIFQNCRTQSDPNLEILSFASDEEIKTFAQYAQTLSKVNPKDFFEALICDEKPSKRSKSEIVDINLVYLNRLVDNVNCCAAIEKALVQFPNEAKRIVLNLENANPFLAFKLLSAIGMDDLAKKCEAKLTSAQQAQVAAYKVSCDLMDKPELAIRALVKQKELSKTQEEFQKNVFQYVIQAISKKCSIQGRMDKAVTLMEKLATSKLGSGKYVYLYPLEDIRKWIKDNLIDKGMLKRAYDIFAVIPFFKHPLHQIWFNFELAARLYSQNKLGDAYKCLAKGIDIARERDVSSDADVPLEQKFDQGVWYFKRLPIDPQQFQTAAFDLFFALGIEENFVETLKLVSYAFIDNSHAAKDDVAKSLDETYGKLLLNAVRNESKMEGKLEQAGLRVLNSSRLMNARFLCLELFFRCVASHKKQLLRELLNSSLTEIDIIKWYKSNPGRNFADDLKALKLDVAILSSTLIELVETLDETSSLKILEKSFPSKGISWVLQHIISFLPQLTDQNLRDNLFEKFVRGLSKLPINVMRNCLWRPGCERLVVDVFKCMLKMNLKSAFGLIGCPPELLSTKEECMTILLDELKSKKIPPNKDELKWALFIFNDLLQNPTPLSGEQDLKSLLDYFQNTGVNIYGKISEVAKRQGQRIEPSELDFGKNNALKKDDKGEYLLLMQALKEVCFYLQLQ